MFMFIFLVITIVLSSLLTFGILNNAQNKSAKEGASKPSSREFLGYFSTIVVGGVVILAVAAMLALTFSVVFYNIFG